MSKFRYGSRGREGHRGVCAARRRGPRATGGRSGSSSPGVTRSMACWRAAAPESACVTFLPPRRFRRTIWRTSASATSRKAC